MIEIKTADKNDILLIQQLAYSIWRAVYKDILSEDKIEYMLSTMHSIPALTKLMDDGHQFILPYENGIAKGYACYKIHPAKVRIEKLYVLPDQHKKGIGNLMVGHITNEAKGIVDTIELNVYRENKAVGFYKRLGFEIVKEVDIPIGKGYFMNDYVMALTL